MIAAVYSRKSKLTLTGESVENQIQLCKEYGKQLKVTEYITYEDEGFSGGNIDRPQFKTMMIDAKNKKFDVLICYRLDRISRNVADFSATLELLTKYDIAFVSIKERFDTTSPMGRAMVYISSVFAQLERETIAERVRDNMLELSKTGRWLGGMPLLGFKSERVKENGKNVSYLFPVEEELVIVKLIFEKYVELGSQYKVYKYLYENNIGFEYRKWAVDRIMNILRGTYYVKTNNAVKQYCQAKGITVIGDMNGNGMVPYNQKKGTNRYNPTNEWIYAIAPHDSIIEAEMWIKIQVMMDIAKEKDTFKRGTSQLSFLTGLLKCSECGSSLYVKLGTKRDHTGYYHYYSCKGKNFPNNCKSKNYRQETIDNAIIEYLDKISTDKNLLETLSKTTTSINVLKEIDELKKLKSTIAKNDTAIHNLINQLSLLSPEASGYLIIEIEKLSKENAKFKLRLLTIENANEKKELAESDKSIFYDQVKNFNKLYNKCKSMDEKRILFNSILKEIIWDNKNKQIRLTFLNE